MAVCNALRSDPVQAFSRIVMKGRSSAEAAAGTSIRQRPQCILELTLIRIIKPTGCFNEFISAGLDPYADLRLVPKQPFERRLP